MRLLIQRVVESTVTVDGKKVSSIKKGLLVFVGIETNDESEDIDWLVKKLTQLRIFNDNNNIMNLNISEIDGDIMLISQFTLHAKTKKGNRPSYVRAAKPEHAKKLYDEFIEKLEKKLQKKVETGIFGAMMKVSLINDGPVTIFIDSKQKE